MGGYIDPRIESISWKGPLKGMSGTAPLERRGIDAMKTQYKECPLCGQQMSLSRGLWLCRNIRDCAYTEPAEGTDLNDPHFLTTAKVRQRIRRSYAGARIQRSF